MELGAASFKGGQTQRRESNEREEVDAGVGEELEAQESASQTLAWWPREFRVTAVMSHLARRASCDELVLLRISENVRFTSCFHVGCALAYFC